MEFLEALIRAPSHLANSIADFGIEKLWGFVGDARIVVERKSATSSSAPPPQVDLTSPAATLREQKLKSFYVGTGFGVVGMGVLILFIDWFNKKKKNEAPPAEVNLVINVSKGNFSFKVIENDDSKETMDGAGSGAGKASDVQDVQTENSGKNPSSSEHQ